MNHTMPCNSNSTHERFPLRVCRKHASHYNKRVRNRVQYQKTTQTKTQQCLISIHTTIFYWESLSH
jgi:hypothetical protein